MTEFSSAKGLKFGVSHYGLLMIPACLLMTGCGGGASSNNSNGNVSVNQPPVASASSKFSVVTEGQPFELDASRSRDANGDTLRYEWRQTGGTAVDIVSPSDPALKLVAPMLEADEALSFELTVSDGEFSRVSTVSLNVENLKVDAIVSEATQYGTGGPTEPVETIPDPSLYEGNKPLDQIIGLTTANEDGYRVHWAGSGGHDMPVSSQSFTVDGQKVGDQTDGVFLGGDRGTYEQDGQIFNRFEFGITFATIQSDETLFNLNARIEFGDNFSFDYTSYRGLVDGEIDGFGDEWFPQFDSTQRYVGGAFTSIGQDNIIITFSEIAAEEVEEENPVVNMTSFVIDKFGQAVTHDLGSYESHGTISGRTGMTLTSYNEDNYFTAWSQSTENTGSDIRMQRANEDGILFGEQTTVNAATEGEQINPQAVTLTNGNIFVTWLNLTDSEEAGRQIVGRIVRPDGTFVTDDVVLGPTLPPANGVLRVGDPFYALTALNTNEVLLTWSEIGADERRLRALVFDSEMNTASNDILVARGDEAHSVRTLQAITLPDNRVIMGWHNDYPYADEREDTSHTIGFYPVGKE